MSAIGAGGGVAAGDMTALWMQGMGPAGAQAKGQANGQPQAKGNDLGHDGALSRGQGFSQRDAFSPAKPIQQDQQTAEARLSRQVQRMADTAMVLSSYGPGDLESRDTLRKLREKFVEWLKEMGGVFRAPAPGVAIRTRGGSAAS